MKKSFLFLFLTLVFLNSDISPAIALGDCTASEVREYKKEGYDPAEIRELCLGEEGGEEGNVRSRGDRRRPANEDEDGRRDIGGLAYTCDCGQGVMCPLNLSGALPREAPCFCNFGYMGNCRGRAR
ncbi:MAG: hypothetical protein KC592_17645 [Nitrospira sp.]|nr:hypothetical protein [Nitrospira sp.]MCW5782239.1 hypothetical protein [Nitrospirales bacterium]